MRKLSWLLLVLFAIGTHASWPATEEDSDCIEWATVRLQQLPEEFHGPRFDEGQIELLDISATHPLPEEFHGPRFDEGRIELQHLPEEFHGPTFDEGRIELLEASTTAPPMRMPEDFYLPKFEDGGIVLLDTPTTTTVRSQQLHEEFHGPMFDEGRIELLEASTTTVRPQQLPEEFHGPVFEEGRIELLEASTTAPPMRIPEDLHMKKEQSSFERLFGKPLYEPGPVTQYFLDLVATEAPVHDSFSSGISDKKTEVEPIRSLPEPKVAVHDEFTLADEVRDEFVAKSKQPKRTQRPKKERGPGPVAQFFLDLVGAEAPVHDSFSSGISDEAEIEPIRSLPEPKATVHDEFTLVDGDKAGYRKKRSANATPVPANNAIWKRVCVRRLPKPKPRVLTAADFLDAQVELNERISRCVGRFEGEHVAAGLCRKYYLRCTAPTISVLMCSHMGEVFSEAMKQCVPKVGLGECDIKRALRSRMISFSPERNASKPKEPVVVQQEVFQGDTNTFCLDRPDGFYRDDKNCSRVLQCFDKELFEYPSCSEPLVFDVRRGVCDYRVKVPGCTNN